MTRDHSKTRDCSGLNRLLFLAEKIQVQDQTPWIGQTATLLKMCFHEVVFCPLVSTVFVCMAGSGRRGGRRMEGDRKQITQEWCVLVKSSRPQKSLHTNIWNRWFWAHFVSVSCCVSTLCSWAFSDAQPEGIWQCVIFFYIFQLNQRF